MASTMCVFVAQKNVPSLNIKGSAWGWGQRLPGCTPEGAQTRSSNPDLRPCSSLLLPSVPLA